MADRGTWKLTVGGQVLADYADVVEPADNDGGPEVQSVRLFRGAGIKNYERGNLEIVLSFSVVKEQATNKAAGTFYITGPKTWNGVKDVEIKHKSHDGSEDAWTITGASVRLKVRPPIGVTNVATVTIRGGNLA